jgi:hypothetical protein
VLEPGLEQEPERVVVAVAAVVVVALGQRVRERREQARELAEETVVREQDCLQFSFQT